MSSVTPSSADELCRFLRNCKAESQTVNVVGNNSKHRLGGPCTPAAHTLSTAALKRVLQYEPNDLTISVEAGMPWKELQSTLARNGQMIALDPPWNKQATVGGVIATNGSGPMRRGYGTARDLVIGMQFATLEGKLVRSGGMVVKNVAGLDMAKLMIGSFGSLAVIASVNFRVHPLAEQTETFLQSSRDLESSVRMRDSLLNSPLRPFAMDLLTPAAAARFGLRGYVLAVRAGGSRRVLDRYRRELSTWQHLSGEDDARFWTQLCEFPAEFLARQRSGAVLRLATPLAEVGTLLQFLTDPAVSRAASGVTYIFLNSSAGIQPVWAAAAKQGWGAVVEGGSEEIRSQRELWLTPSGHFGETFALMQQIKHMFDPGNLLNMRRLYGRI